MAKAIVTLLRRMEREKNAGKKLHNKAIELKNCNKVIGVSEMNLMKV